MHKYVHVPSIINDVGTKYSKHGLYGSVKTVLMTNKNANFRKSVDCEIRSR